MYCLEQLHKRRRGAPTPFKQSFIVSFQGFTHTPFKGHTWGRRRGVSLRLYEWHREVYIGSPSKRVVFDDFVVSIIQQAHRRLREPLVAQRLIAWVWLRARLCHFCAPRQSFHRSSLPWKEGFAHDPLKDITLDTDCYTWLLALSFRSPTTYHLCMSWGWPVVFMV